MKMKPTKKKPAKRAVRTGSIEHKLMQLYNRIDESFDGVEHKDDKSWVIKLISDVRENNLTKLCKEDVLKCNAMWRTYE